MDPIHQHNKNLRRNTMTTATLAQGNRATAAVKPRRRLEDLVDRLFAALTFGDEPDPPAVAASPDLSRTIHDARRLRQGVTWTGRWRPWSASTRRRRTPARRGDLLRGRSSLSSGASTPGGFLCTARERDGLPPWCPALMAAALRRW